MIGIDARLGIRLDLAHGLQAVHARHQVIHEDHVGPAVLEVVERRFRRVGGIHEDPVALEHPREHDPSGPGIVDDQRSLARDHSALLADGSLSQAVRHSDCEARRPLLLHPVPGPEHPRDDRDAGEQEHERHREAQPDGDVRLAEEAPAKAADQVHDRVEQRDRAPGRAAACRSSRTRRRGRSAASRSASGRAASAPSSSPRCRR